VRQFFHSKAKLAALKSLCRRKKLPPTAVNQKDPGFELLSAGAFTWRFSFYLSCLLCKKNKELASLTKKPPSRKTGETHRNAPWTAGDRSFCPTHPAWAIAAPLPLAFRGLLADEQASAAVESGVTTTWFERKPDLVLGAYFMAL
jgi:hypothetical protein